MIKNIVLIGMPGAGKSTAGVLLAKALGMDFCDTDILIQRKANTTLQKIIEERGIEEFLKLENEVLSGVSMENTVIATGGSAVYSKDAMENLCKNGIVVYLKLTPDVLVSRLSNIKTRGIAMKKGQTIESLFEERNPLYEKYALYTVDENSLSVEETVTDIICKLNS